MNARYYNPKTGRFLSQDTYSGNVYEPWTQHLYSYCGNNPTNFVDPTGHSVASIQQELDELKKIRKFRITLRDNYAKNRWEYDEGSDMFNLLTDAWQRNRGIVKDLNKQISAKEDELEAAFTETVVYIAGGTTYATEVDAAEAFYNAAIPATVNNNIEYACVIVGDDQNGYEIAAASSGTENFIGVPAMSVIYLFNRYGVSCSVAHTHPANKPGYWGSEYFSGYGSMLEF
jgi:hypothetical protein